MIIYNSLTKKKEPFEPIQPGKVTIYACGVTVYDYFHIGNARMMIVFDMVVRYFRSRGFDVTYVQNITDIDDKIIARARERGVSYQVITDQFIAALHEDQAALGLLPPDIEPKATEYVFKMIAMIERLVASGHAYVASDGDVLYSVESFSEYGKLSHRNLEDLQAGSRVEVDVSKRNPLDFVLWKMAKPEEPSWDSPWGKGRPGWHIECSVMAEACLGEQIDIHGGGMDLKFPHHENEIAQTEACTHKTFSKCWMHVGFLQIDNEKMSKSLGNFSLARDVLKQAHPEVIRYFMLSAHYRQPLNYSDMSFQQSREAMERFYLCLRDLKLENEEPFFTDEIYVYEKRFCEAMDDDFNTPEAFSVLFELTKEVNRAKSIDTETASNYALMLKRLANTLGLLKTSPAEFLQGYKSTGISAEVIEKLIQDRVLAREKKDFKKSDLIRKELEDAGVLLEDVSGRTIWRWK